MDNYILIGNHIMLESSSNSSSRHEDKHNLRVIEYETENSIHCDITCFLHDWETAERDMKNGSRDHEHRAAETSF